MINALQLGNKHFPVNLIQGPLAGISCAPFRRLTWQYSPPAFSCTEMISCNTIIHQPTQSLQRFITKSALEGPVCFQLSANNAIDLAKATQRVTEYGADLIDLNCGCPVNKIRSKGAGSSLLMEPRKLYQMISAMKKNTHLPVSIKIRVEGGSNDIFNQEVAQVVSDAGADFLIVHGRHWTEHYETPCHHDEIQFFVETLAIPVIGNGDIACIDSLKKMFATGCAGVMLGRAGVGQPWLIGQLIAEMTQQKFTVPSPQKIGMIFLEHVTELALLLQNEKFALLQGRKLAKYYGRHLPNKMELMAAINQCEKLADLEKICLAYF
jgi:tRNA-dihydrouridine synthase B